MGGEPGAPCSLLPTRQSPAGDCLLSLLSSHLPSLEPLIPSSQPYWEMKGRKMPGKETSGPYPQPHAILSNSPPIQSSSTILRAPRAARVRRRHTNSDPPPTPSMTPSTRPAPRPERGDLLLPTIP